MYLVTRESCERLTLQAKYPSLPFEPGPGMLIHPSRRIGFDQLYCLDNSQLAAEVDQQVRMVLNPADLDRTHAVVFCNPGHIGPQLWLHLLFDGPDAALVLKTTWMWLLT